MRTHTITACNLICGKPLRPCIQDQDAQARPMKLRLYYTSIYKKSMPRRPINKHAGIIVKVKKEKESRSALFQVYSHSYIYIYQNMTKK